MTVGRRLRSRAAGGQLDRASVLVLYHVLSSGPVRLSDLARSMGLDASTVSRHVGNLESGGHLTRTEDPGDRRASRVLLTDRGRAVLDESMRAQAALVDRAIAAWPEADRRALLSLMDRLAGQMETESR
jgi:DNA-binding MarR family transcriptional regulator